MCSNMLATNTQNEIKTYWAMFVVLKYLQNPCPVLFLSNLHLNYIGSPFPLCPLGKLGQDQLSRPTHKTKHFMYFPGGWIFPCPPSWEAVIGGASLPDSKTLNLHTFATRDLLIHFTAQLAQFLRSGYFLSSSSLCPPSADVLLIAGF